MPLLRPPNLQSIQIRLPHNRILNQAHQERGFSHPKQHEHRPVEEPGYKERCERDGLRPQHLNRLRSDCVDAGVAIEERRKWFPIRSKPVQVKGGRRRRKTESIDEDVEEEKATAANESDDDLELEANEEELDQNPSTSNG
jgi:hypothetical protein